ncbi:hypothetical protein [Halovibrio variabilis]|uniref:hypothetical protein n=1 Tax=Halovibrio variabilis TaxID=31910 RepID=UPI0011BED540|nr:hypothetical protein [Halovibrio variabilis]
MSRWVSRPANALSKRLEIAAAKLKKETGGSVIGHAMLKGVILFSIVAIADEGNLHQGHITVADAAWEPGNGNWQRATAVFIVCRLFSLAVLNSTALKQLSRQLGEWDV